MDDLLESVTMSTSGSEGDAALDGVAANSRSERTNDNLPLREALRKLREGGHDTEILPQSINNNLWDEIRSTFALSLMEVVALKNCAPARPRGVLRQIENSTMYRISDTRVQASFTISNVVNSCKYTLEAELLVDPGANTGLKLPARKVVQLGLRPFGRPTQARGSTNATTYNIHFNPVLVTAIFIRNGVSETIEAYLDVKCDKNEYEALQEAGQAGMAPSTGTGAERSYLTPNQPINAHPSSTNQEGITVIQLSPTHHRPNGLPLQQAVIGMDGLRKLRLHLNCDQCQLEIEEDELVEDEED
jgi:hypothetical protein